MIYKNFLKLKHSHVFVGSGKLWITTYQGTHLTKQKLQFSQYILLPCDDVGRQERHIEIYRSSSK